jgi:xanthine dehydrogenase accessory factor
MFMARATTVVVRGGGDLGSGVALRLWRAGFTIAVLESNAPVAVRRTVSLCEAVYDGEASVEELQGVLVTSALEMPTVWSRGFVPVLVDPQARSVGELSPVALVDAILAKRNIGTSISMAPLTIGLGPGFTAGGDVTAVVETNRGPHLGRVLWHGGAEPNTHHPAPVSGYAEERVLRSPSDGPLKVLRDIGSLVEPGDVLASVAGEPIAAPFRGMVRGMARPGLVVGQGMKVGDLDPRLDPGLCSLVSDKSLAIAGGVLEAICMYLRDN